MTRRNPFALFNVESPGNIKRMPPAGAVPQVRLLLMALGRSTTISTATREAAERLRQATDQIERAFRPLQTVQDELRAARSTSDVVGSCFDSALSTLRLAARIAGYEGAPGLHAALFPPRRRAAKKKAGISEPPIAPAAQPSAAPA